MPFQDSVFDIIIDHVSLRFIVSRRSGRVFFSNSTTVNENMLVRVLLAEYMRVLRSDGVSMLFADNLSRPYISQVLLIAYEMNLSNSVRCIYPPTYVLEAGRCRKKIDPRYKPTFLVVLEKEKGSRSSSARQVATSAECVTSGKE